MANVTITQLPAAGPITGTESVPIVQNGQTVQTTTGAIAASPSQNQTFLTLNNEPSLPNSRYLSTGTGLGLTDGGAQSDLEIILNGASGSLEVAGNGVIVKTGSTTVTARTISTSGAGLTVSNGNGVSGNPTIALDGLPASLANMSGTGILGVVGGSSITSMVITGTNNQITVANGSGPGNPTISITTDPIIPGTGAMTIPKGTTAQRPGGVNGMIRFNTDTDGFEIYDSGGWSVLPAGAITLINTGTGLTGGPITTSGTISIANTGVGAGIYGDASSTVELHVNAQGQITAATQMTISISPSQIVGGFFDTTQGGTGLGAYTAGDMLFYLTGTSFDRLPIGSNNYVMTSDGSIPQWSDPATITVGTATTATSATNIAGGAGGQLVYNTNASTTSFIPLGTLGYLLQAGLTDPIYVDPATVTVGTATTATNVAGGAANQIVYNTASSTTSFIAAPSAPGEYLGWNGSAFVWSSVSATSATNLSGGTAGALPYQTGVGATGFLNLGTTTFLLRAGASAPEYVDPSSVTVGSATNATNASNATNITVTDNTLSASTYYPVVSLNTTGSNAPTTSSTKLSFVPSTGVLSATEFSGALNGTVGATTPNAGTFTTLTANTVSEFGRSSANYWQAIGAATTLTPEFATLGSDTNISATFRSKGTGAINFAGGSGGVNISNGGTVTAITRTNAGSGYTSAPDVTISPPTTAGGVQATATVAISGGSITTFTITNAGSGYVEQPTVTFSGGGGSGAAAFASVGSPVSLKSVHGSISLLGPNSTLLVATETGNATQAYFNFQGSNGNTLNYANGSATNIGHYFITKGTGQFSFTTNGATANEQLRVAHTASAVNYVQVTGSATAPSSSSIPTISVQGSDSTTYLGIGFKGNSGYVAFFKGGSISTTNTLMRASGIVGNVANYFDITPATTGNAPTITSAGSDTDIDLALTPKGTGRVTTAAAIVATGGISGGTF